MGITSTRLPGFCLNRVATRIRVRSPRIVSKPISNGADSGHLSDFSCDMEKNFSNGTKNGDVHGRRIMIVVDSSNESKSALQWALSHTVQSQDTLLLLNVNKPSKHGGECQRELDPRGYQLLYTMKNICQAKKPEVQVEVSVVEGNERGPTIVEEARKQAASLLVLGQKKRPVTWRLLLMWAGNRVGGGITDYCIQNASCMTLAVRRRSRKAGGYLITTRRHKDFWLLA